jgi:hypothetical protein
MKKWSHSAEGTVQLEAQRHTKANSIKVGNRLRFEIEPSLAGAPLKPKPKTGHK